jgi:hypothetical protein
MNPPRFDRRSRRHYDAPARFWQVFFLDFSFLGHVPTPRLAPLLHMPFSWKSRRVKVAAGLLVVVVVAGLGWLDSRSKWMTEREAHRTWIVTHAGFIQDELSTPPAPRPAPWSLRPFGEPGVSTIVLDEATMIDKLGTGEGREPEVLAASLKRLFPEATIVYRDLRGLEKRLAD